MSLLHTIISFLVPVCQQTAGTDADEQAECVIVICMHWGAEQGSITAPSTVYKPLLFSSARQGVAVIPASYLQGGV